MDWVECVCSFGKLVDWRQRCLLEISGANRFSNVLCHWFPPKITGSNDWSIRSLSDSERSVRQEAVGLVLNEKLNVPRDEFDRLKAILHKCVLRGPSSVNAGEHPNFRLHLIGRIQYVDQSNQSRRLKLMKLFDQM